jgi:WD40 repeat protein
MATTGDGTLVAIPFDDGRFELWHTDASREPVRLATVSNAHTGGTFAAAFHPDGRLLATGGPDRRVRLWDVADPAAPTPIGDPLPERPGAVFAVAFSPDGNTVAAAGGEGATWLYDVSRPEAPAQLGDPLGGHNGPVYGAAFSPTEPLMATAGVDGLVWLWDVSNLQAPRNRGGRPALENDGGAALWVAFDRTGKLAVANADGSTWIWDVRSLDPVLRARLVGHQQAVMGATFLPDEDRVVTASADRTGVVWRLDEETATEAALNDVGDPLTDRERRRYLSDPSPAAAAVAVPGYAQFAIRRLVRLWRA